MRKIFILLLFTCTILSIHAQDLILFPFHSKITNETNENVRSQINSMFTSKNSEIIDFSLKGVLPEKEDLNDEISIYPNPVNVGEIWSIKNVPLNSTIEIFNSLGQKIGKTIVSTSSTILFDENLSKGAYIVKIQYNNTIETLRLVIR